MKTFTYGTTKRASLDKFMKKLIDDGTPFAFQKRFFGHDERFLIKIRFADAETAKRMWNDANWNCDNSFSLTYRG